MTPEPLSWLLSAFTFAVAMSGTPGPNNAMVAASGATFGFARTLPHMLGIAVGFPLMLLAVALGAGQVLRAVPVLHDILKWIGVAYLVWLAWKIGTARPGLTESSSGARPLTFLQASLFQWVNPKAWIIALGAVATYTTAERVIPQALVLACIFLIVTLPLVAAWTMTGVGAARLLKTRGGLRAFNLAMAALLILSLIPVLLD